MRKFPIARPELRLLSCGYSDSSRHSSVSTNNLTLLLHCAVSLWTAYAACADARKLPALNHGTSDPSEGQKQTHGRLRARHERRKNQQGDDGENKSLRGAGSWRKQELVLDSGVVYRTRRGTVKQEVLLLGRHVPITLRAGAPVPGPGPSGLLPSPKFLASASASS